MKRKTYLTLLVASVVLGVAALLLWWQSYHAARYLVGSWAWGEQTHAVSVGIEPGQLALMTAVKPLNDERGVATLVRQGRIPDSMAWADDRASGEFIGFRFYRVTYTEHMIRPRREYIVDLPAWFFVLIGAGGATLAVYRMRKPGDVR